MIKNPNILLTFIAAQAILNDATITYAFRLQYVLPAMFDRSVQSSLWKDHGTTADLTRCRHPNKQKDAGQ